MSWEKLTGNGMVAGAISGTATALIAWLSVASLYGDGLSDFLHNTKRSNVIQYININFSAILWREQVIFDEITMIFALY
jgi:hypothetical protein